MDKNSKNKKGFTLIELLVVIAIIGILATFIVASFASAQARGRDARRKADLEAIQTALELFKSDSRGAAFYPIGPEGAATLNAALVPNYIKLVPADPGDTAIPYEYGGGLRGGGACAGNTIVAATCDDYRLTAILENGNDPQAAASQTSCLIAYGVPAYVNTPAAATYVVCGN